jgi:integrase
MSLYDGHEGIKEDRYGIKAYVAVGTKPNRRQKTHRFKRGTPIKKITDWQDRTRIALRDGVVPTPTDTLRADAVRYLEHMKAPGPDGNVPAGYGALCCEINAWLPDLGEIPRHQITREMILDIRLRWRTTPRGGTGTTARVTKPISPKTCNHRVRALRALYHFIDGSKADTPCDDIDKLKEPDADPKFVDVKTILKVAKNLKDQPQTLGRFMVLTATGQRPAQLKRAQPDDLDLRRGVWMVRPAKGGNAIPIVLTKDMTVAFAVFVKAAAWGYFDGSDYAKALYAAGWPKGIRPYNAKHTVAITLGESGAEWEDIKDWLGQKDTKTTKIYTGHILARTRGTAKRLEGRIGWEIPRRVRRRA